MLHTQAGITSFIDELVAQGLSNVVLSPGSRVAPITLALERHSKLNIYMAKDERSAAFMACGISIGSGNPTLIACTSGTAVLNYLPAIAEAFYQEVPLIVLSADRPPQWIDQQDGQALKQGALFSDFVSFETSLPTRALSESELYTFRLTAAEAYDKTTSARKPVHINAPLDEPLYDIPYPDICKKRLELPKPVLESQNEAIPKALLDTSASIHRAVIVVGQLRPDIGASIQLRLNKLAENGWVVVTDPLSNCHSENSVEQIELLLYKEQVEPPEVVVQIGGPVLSKKLKRWLWYGSNLVISVDKDGRARDPFISLKAIWKTEIPLALDALCLRDVEKTYAQTFLEQTSQASENLKTIRQGTELARFHETYAALSSNSNIFLGNSLPVRHLQYTNRRGDLFHYANRGICGIDGVSSTAIGLCIGSRKTTTLITGDLSFVHDANAMWDIDWPDNFKIVVINNGGGNIFRFIEGPQKSKSFETSFFTPNKVDIKSLCQAFGKKHKLIIYEEDIQPHLLPSSEVQVLELKVDPIESNTELKKILK